MQVYADEVCHITSQLMHESQKCGPNTHLCCPSKDSWSVLRTSYFVLQTITSVAIRSA